MFLIVLTFQARKGNQDISHRFPRSRLDLAQVSG